MSTSLSGTLPAAGRQSCNDTYGKHHSVHVCTGPSLAPEGFSYKTTDVPLTSK